MDETGGGEWLRCTADNLVHHYLGMAGTGCRQDEEAPPMYCYGKYTDKGSQGAETVSRLSPALLVG